MPRRSCSRPSCARPAIATLTYVYADSTAVLGPLATYAEPHCYDLCDIHGERLTAPRGWEVVRITPDPDSLRPTSDDLEALADAVREAARPRFHQHDLANQAPTVEVARRGHLRMLASTVVEPADPSPPTNAPHSERHVTEPNWHLGEDGELDELLDDDGDFVVGVGAAIPRADMTDESVDGLEIDDIGGALVGDDEDDVFDIEGYADAELDEPVEESTGRARVLNLPLRSQGDERAPS